ncbi:MAG: hypothetical protein IKO49_03150 [Bacilli bacterium]|nr:hypothetical protein [Bacilli bacterium]
MTRNMKTKNNLKIKTKEKENKKVVKDNNNLKHKVNEESESLKKKKTFYLSFNARVFIKLLLVCIILMSLIASVFMSFSITKSKTINYTHKSSIDYKVYLKENNFYTSNYLGKGMAYIASLIDKINIDYNYQFNSNEKSDIDLKYKVMAKLVIASQRNSKIFYENEYEIAKEEIAGIRSNDKYLLNKNVIIDYDYYNNLANRFKSNYAVNTTSYLEVYLVVNEESKETNSYSLNDTTKTILSIPLSENEINIGLKENTVNETKQIISDSEFLLGDIKFIVIDVVLLLLFIIVFIKLVKEISVLLSKTSNYDKYIGRILRGYDRLIVNVKTAPNMDDYNIIKVESFEELVDVRDNVKEPIRYFVITEHQKCEFFIVNHSDLYLYIVKAVDLDNSLVDKEKSN